MDTNINSRTICTSLGYASNFSVAATVKISAGWKLHLFELVQDSLGDFGFQRLRLRRTSCTELFYGLFVSF